MKSRDWRLSAALTPAGQPLNNTQLTFDPKKLFSQHVCSPVHPLTRNYTLRSVCVRVCTAIKQIRWNAHELF